MIRNMFPFLIFTSFLLGEDPNTPSNNQLSSTHASYNGNALVLQGRVELDHGLGNMTADEAFLQKQETGKDFPFSVIELKKNVLLSLKNKAELRCDLAELDFNDLKGSLSAEEKVSYKDFLKKEGASSVPFYIMSKLIDLQLVKQETVEDSHYAIQSLVAKKEVEIEYSKEFLLKADEASYQNLEPKNSKEMNGIIEAYPTSLTSHCKISYQGENIDADFIHIDIKNSQIQMKKPNGSIPSGLFNQNETPLLFHCGNLLWDHEKETLFLKEQVSIQESTLGFLYAEKEMILVQGKTQNKKTIESIHIDGPSCLEHKDSSSDWKHKVSSFGSLHVDGVKGLITLTSPSDQKKQICYEDLEVILRANKASIEYSESDRKPLSLTLQGDVTIQSALEGPLRLGIADRLTYNPETQTVILSALPKKRVLFQDEEQNLSMSAQEVHLTKDPLSGKTQVKGIGNVKFSLTIEEGDTLKNRFLVKAKESNNVSE